MAHNAGHVPDVATVRANIALGLAGLAVVLYVLALAVAQDQNDWLWPVAGLIGGAAAAAGWMVGKPPQGKALAAVILGGLVFITILGWTAVSAATGNL